MSGAKGTWATGNNEVEGEKPKSPRGIYRATHDYITELESSLDGYGGQAAKVIEWIDTLAESVESLRQHYNSVVEETGKIVSLIKVAEGHIAQVQRFVNRYGAVTDPVVASDGFTYERELITDYFKECEEQKNVPMSQQTKCELTTQLYPNRSFKRFLEQLMATTLTNIRIDTSCGSSGGQGNYSGGANANSGASGRHAGNGESNHKGDAGDAGADESRLHPCVRVYGFCNYKDTCAYATYPYNACLSHLKGKCRFRDQCHEPHVEFRSPFGPTSASSAEGRGDGANGTT